MKELATLLNIMIVLTSQQEDTNPMEKLIHRHEPDKGEISEGAAVFIRPPTRDTNITETHTQTTENIRSIEWFKDNISIYHYKKGRRNPDWYNSRASINFRMAAEFALHITQATKQHRGKYTCLTHYTDGEVHEKVTTIAIRYLGTPILLSGDGQITSRYIYIAQNEAKIITCATVGGFPQPTIQWTIDGKTTNGTTPTTNTEERTESVLIQPITDNEDKAIITCKVGLEDKTHTITKSVLAAHRTIDNKEKNTAKRKISIQTSDQNSGTPKYDASTKCQLTPNQKLIIISIGMTIPGIIALAALITRTMENRNLNRPTNHNSQDVEITE